MTMCRLEKTKKVLPTVVVLFAMSLLVPRAASSMDWVGDTLTGMPCRGQSQGFGPFDYFDVNDETDALYRKGRFWEIDKVHTDRAIRVMKDGANIRQGDFQTASNNIDYTLRAIPNEPRALQAVIQLSILQAQSPNSLRNPNPPPECYFQRAYAFRSDQVHIPLLYGLFLHKIEQSNAALEQFLLATEIDDKSAEANYNTALLLIDLSRVREAVPYAARAYELGYPLQGLRRKLGRLGHPID